MPNDPINRSELTSTSFQFSINDLDHLNYFAVAANLPGLVLGDITQFSPVGNINWSGDGQFEELQVQFIVDEDLKNWMEIFTWIRSATTLVNRNDYDIENLRKDGSLIIRTNTLSPNVHVSFKGLIPRSLSGIDFDSRSDASDIIVATVSFGYIYYDVECHF